MNRPIRCLDPETFAPYGVVLQLAPDAVPGFHNLLTQPDVPGWTWAISKLTRRHVDTLGAHPDTKETFEPLSGVALIAVAPPDSPEAFEVFLLDRPICVNENVWHATCALSAEASLKIVENAKVTGVSYALLASYHPLLAA